MRIVESGAKRVGTVDEDGFEQRAGTAGCRDDEPAEAFAIQEQESGAGSGARTALAGSLGNERERTERGARSETRRSTSALARHEDLAHRDEHQTIAARRTLRHDFAERL